MTSKPEPHRTTTLVILTSYVICGVLHELSHLIVASCLLSSSSTDTTTTSAYSVIDIVEAVVRAVVGRYSIIQVSDQHYDGDIEYDKARSIITHAGWILSVMLAVGCHVLHNNIATRTSSTNNNMQPQNNGKFGMFNTQHVRKVFLNPTIPIVAYITALEAIVTDLFGFTPIHPYLGDYNKTDNSSSTIIICFCGNFGILLLNPSWLSIDGGRTALDVLEKMINVTMMRGMCMYACYVCVICDLLLLVTVLYIDEYECILYLQNKYRCSIWGSGYI